MPEPQRTDENGVKSIGVKRIVEEKPTGAVMEKTGNQHRVIVRGKSHMPSDSLLFERIVPVILAVLGIVTLVLILFAAGVLLGIVPFR
jgi:hypothetical protein